VSLECQEKYPEIRIYAVVVDICASGGYYVAVAADKIFADKASLVGSIGVLMNGFGFVNTMEKLGVERRLLTAGEHKGFLDPFSPMKPSDAQHMRKVLSNTHEQFMGIVRKGRGSRLKETPEMFSGLIWSGEQGLALGLIDGLGSTSYVAREVVGVDNIVDFTRNQDPLRRFAEKFGVSFGSALAGFFGVAPGTSILH
jgi:protease-4